MNRRFVIVGTDTGVGKTIVSAAIVGALNAYYWKPVQAGLDGETDSQTVARLSGAPGDHILPEAWRLCRAASPHLAARDEGVEIDAAALNPPSCDDLLVIETAGGAMTPLSDRALTIDVLERWRMPVILVARTSLGTINHSLLTLEALRRRGIPIKGIIFVGDADAGAQRAIETIGGARILGRLPRLDPLNQKTLIAAFNAAIARDAFGSGA
ncbi:dethiobiotin synthase [Methylocystis sp. B8]|uniref:dethiobiotin synthase n=1 Tax=Methylocystis sp. B8 TaxID=544938 RepID=UPI0010FF28BC|nr:dethiobiotin synthase [Methylocystis sp. B8]TLG78228.1 ATP-dependent dethiobiotin synthetase BioD [Methylocystis sp. B8]